MTETLYNDFKCFCGKRSVEIDTWFNWYPCKDHKHLSPVLYRELALETKKEVKEKE